MKNLHPEQINTKRSVPIFSLVFLYFISSFQVDRDVGWMLSPSLHLSAFHTPAGRQGGGMRAVRGIQDGSR